MSIPFNATHYEKKARLPTDPLYHGETCEALYRQIAGLKIHCKLRADSLKNDKSKANRIAFNELVEQIRRFKVCYEYEYLLAAPLDKRGNEKSYNWRLNHLAKQLGIEPPLPEKLNGAQ